MMNNEQASVLLSETCDYVEGISLICKDMLSEARSLDCKEAAMLRLIALANAEIGRVVSELMEA